MAKKKITKKPVSKRIAKTTRTTRATLDERNERLGTSNAPKARKPRVKKPEVVVTTESASKVLWFEGSAAEFLSPVDPPEAAQVVSTLPPASPVNPQITDSVTQQITKFIKKADRAADRVFEKVRDFSFNYPATFAISFCVVLSAVCVGVLYLNRLFRLF